MRARSVTKRQRDHQQDEATRILPRQDLSSASMSLRRAGDDRDRAGGAEDERVRLFWRLGCRRSPGRRVLRDGRCGVCAMTGRRGRGRGGCAAGCGAGTISIIPQPGHLTALARLLIGGRGAFGHIRR
jgi:hypothetical protein